MVEDIISIYNINLLKAPWFCSEECVIIIKMFVEERKVYARSESSSSCERFKTS